MKKIIIEKSVPLKYDQLSNKYINNHIPEANKMISGLNYDSYLKGLIEIANKIDRSGIDGSNQWLNHLLGYIDGASELIKGNDKTTNVFFPKNAIQEEK